ncbi:unnamed protein product [Cylicostephanus goldi]|uniref:Uncharacterized protein n=1 Tax=Cylicostephanus goldi TaxID=71465 RepID=A0A3P7QQA2_CYLGO|nr:unnamed protein product [Cylicostephanus goldi]
MVILRKLALARTTRDKIYSLKSAKKSCTAIWTNYRS